MRIAVMQPYIFPYLGYFQLIKACDVFVFYDDVTYIKNGYINRNNLLINGQRNRFTIPCKAISSYELICNTEHRFNDFAKKKFLKTVESAYRRAPNFQEFYPLLESFVKSDTTTYISDLAIHSVEMICDYLAMDVRFMKSSESFSETKELPREERLTTITKLLKGTQYINPIGGQELYGFKDFKSRGVDLSFVKMKEVPYPQFGASFVPYLSMIDVLMFNSVSQAQPLLEAYDLLYS